VFTKNKAWNNLVPRVSLPREAEKRDPGNEVEPGNDQLEL